MRHHGRDFRHRPELMAEKFIVDPFSGRGGARLNRTGDLARWQAALAELPAAPCIVQLDTEAVTATASTVTDEVTLARYRHALQALQPWRKGPFDLAGIHIDSEWRSQLKWQRIAGAAGTILVIAAAALTLLWQSLG